MTADADGDTCPEAMLAEKGGHVPWKRELNVGTADFKRWAQEARQLNWTSWRQRFAGRTGLYLGTTAAGVVATVALTAGSSEPPTAGADGSADPEQSQPTEAPATGADGDVLVNNDRPDADTRAAIAASPFAGIPQQVLAAYRKAAVELQQAQPACRLPVELLAAIGKVESNHANGGRVEGGGTTTEAILGPVLDGSGNFAAIADTDNGLLDGNERWDRAVGPMQFIPGVWVRWAFDGNSDGVRNPHNVFDASLASAWYLCAGGRDLGNDSELREAIFSYNHSQEYVDLVLSWMATYSAAFDDPSDPDRRAPGDDESTNLADGRPNPENNPPPRTGPNPPPPPPGFPPPGSPPPGFPPPSNPPPGLPNPPPPSPGPQPPDPPRPGDPDPSPDPGDGGSGGLLCVVDETADSLTDIIEDLFGGGGDGGDEDCTEPATTSTRPSSDDSGGPLTPLGGLLGIR